KPRIQIWNCALEVGRSNFLIGNGFGHSQDKLNECFLNENLEDFAKLDYQTHNQYFNHYIRGGIVGLIILLLLYLYSMFFSIKRKNLIHLSLMIIVILTSMTENILNRHLGIVFFVFFNSYFIFIYS